MAGEAVGVTEAPRWQAARATSNRAAKAKVANDDFIQYLNKVSPFYEECLLHFTTIVSAEAGMMRAKVLVTQSRVSARKEDSLT